MKAVNLIPSEHRRARPSGTRSGGAYVVLGVLGVLLAMTAGYVVTSNRVNERTTAAEEARQEADALEARASRLGSFTDFSQIKDQRLGSVMAAAQTRFDWERMMREVSRIMPEGSWLQTTQASVTGDSTSAGGVAPTSSTTVTPAGPTATFVGCTPKQSEVAKLMVRLRALHRVTDVKLNQSAQEQGATQVTVDNCGRLYKFDVTATFEGIAPVNEAPRATTRVPASLGGGS
jgi:Tfp pilus assembly protein PilN